MGRTTWIVAAMLGLGCGADAVPAQAEGEATGSGTASDPDPNDPDPDDPDSDDPDPNDPDSDDPDPNDPDPDDPDPDDPGTPAVCETDAEFPTPDWPQGDPADFGLDADALQAAADYAGEHDTNCMVVIRDGHLVFEQYWGDNTTDTKVKSWSVAKSYASTVAGIALERGDLDDVSDSLADYLPELADGPKAAITLHDLMAMTSGLYMELIDDNLGLSAAADMTQKALDAMVTHDPGELWEYNNHAVQLLEPIIRAQTGVAADEYAREHLWEPISMDAEWLTDQVGQPALYQNVLASCRDHAKFGYLFLHRGCWDGTPVVTEQWVDTATHSSQDLNPGYGYWWWLSGQTPTLDSTDFSELPGGSMHPFGPDDSFCAVGLGSQFIEVIPEHDMVVVRMGIAPHDHPDAWLHPLQTLQALLEDGKQPVHNGVLERVLAAVVQ